MRNRIVRGIMIALVAVVLLAGCAVTGGVRKDMGVVVDTVKTDSFTMDYCMFGCGKRTLVIVPGLSVQSVMPSAQAIADSYNAFADDFTVYVFDRRKDQPKTYSIDDMARDTAAAMEQLGIGNADIFGASQGGMIAMVIAITRPELVHSLILGSTSSRIGDEQYGLIESWVRLAQAGKREDLYLAFVEALYPEAVFESSRELLIQAAATVTDDDLARFVVMATALKGFDMTSCLPDITCPVLVLGSEDDKVVGSEASRVIKEGLTSSPCSRIYMYDGYGHAVYDLAPDYHERMLEFLESN